MPWRFVVDSRALGRRVGLAKDTVNRTPRPALTACGGEAAMPASDLLPGPPPRAVRCMTGDAWDPHVVQIMSVPAESTTNRQRIGHRPARGHAPRANARTAIGSNRVISRRDRTSVVTESSAGTSLALAVQRDEPARRLTEPGHGSLRRSSRRSRLQGSPAYAALFAAPLGTDPYALYARLRSEDPTHGTSLGLWVLTRYADVAAVLRDPRFGREGFERHFGLNGAAWARTPAATGSRCSSGTRRTTRGSATR